MFQGDAVSTTSGKPDTSVSEVLSNLRTCGEAKTMQNIGSLLRCELIKFQSSCPEYSELVVDLSAISTDKDECQENEVCTGIPNVQLYLSLKRYFVFS